MSRRSDRDRSGEWEEERRKKKKKRETRVGQQHCDEKREIGKKGQQSRVLLPSNSKVVMLFIHLHLINTLP